jgi:hypothetical protein
VTITWKLDVGVPSIDFRSWTFLPKGTFAHIAADGEVVNTTQYSPGPFTITKPSTLILKNVNIQYNGTYAFVVVSGVKHTSSPVHVFVAGKCHLYNILYLLNLFFTKRFRIIFRHINKLLYSDWFRQLQLTDPAHEYVDNVWTDFTTVAKVWTEMQEGLFIIHIMIRGIEKE